MICNMASICLYIQWILLEAERRKKHIQPSVGVKLMLVKHKRLAV